MLDKYKSTLKEKLSVHSTPKLEFLAAKFAEGNELDAAKICSEIVKERNGSKFGQIGFTDKDFQHDTTTP